MQQSIQVKWWESPTDNGGHDKVTSAGVETAADYKRTT